MALPLQKFRELVFQLLYSYDYLDQDERAIRELMMRELSVTKKAVRTAQLRVDEVRKHLDELDVLIAATSQEYALMRIQTVERNCLRLGLFELLFDDTIPPKVAITEAMRLTRKFSTPEAAHFVNAVMDTVYKQSLGETKDSQALVRATLILAESEEAARCAVLQEGENVDEFAGEASA